MTQNKPSNGAFIDRKKKLFDVQYGKVPPHNKEAEKAVLGQLLVGSKYLHEVIEILPSCDRFYDHQHQLIYEAILSAHQKGSAIDLIVVINELIHMGKLEDAGGAYGVTNLTIHVIFLFAIQLHAFEIAECYKRREAIRISGELMARSYDDTEAIDENIHESEKQLVELLSVGDISDATSLRDCIIPFNEALSKAMVDDREITGVDTGFGYLNKLTNGWQNGDLIILAARPSVGKTAFALELAKNASVSPVKKVPTAVYSLEMAKLKLMQRLVSNISMIELEKVQRGKLSKIEFDHVQQILNQVAAVSLYIDDTFHLSINQLKSRAKRLKREKNIGFLLVDYLQLMAGDKSKGNREQEISSISRGLKGIAMELDIPVIALSQMSRDIEKNGGKREPMLSDLRESGAIEQDADMVMFIYHETDPNNGEIKNVVKIAKHRNGELGKMDQCKFFPEIQKWMNPHDADAYMAKTGFKPFAGMPKEPEIKNEYKAVLTPYDGEATPF